MNQNTKTFLIVVAVIVAIAGGLIFVATKGDKSKTANSQPDDYSDQVGAVAGATTDTENFSTDYIEKLAKFMSEKGMVMYGAYWCSHCQDQKKLFGNAFQYVDYVECDPQGPSANEAECTARNVTGYPTWIYNSTQYSGQKTLSQLAQIVGFNQTDTATPAPAN